MTAVMKLCRKCLSEKPTSEFYAQTGRPSSPCKECIGAVKRAYNQKTFEKRKARARERRDVRAEMMRLWAAKHREHLNSYMREWRKSAVYARGPGLRGGAVKRRPTWANDLFIKEAYRLARLRASMTGFEWHVDHIVPLNSPLVCGLHVEHNLQVIPSAANWAKGNRHWPDMWEQSK